jgi:Transposase DDE domain
MIIAPSLPQIKGLFVKGLWKSAFGRQLLVAIVAIVSHRGRMSAQQVASAVVGDSRHRGNVGRFLKRHADQLSWVGHQSAQRLLALDGWRRRCVFIVDSTSVSHQGERTPNTFSTGNRRRRPTQGRRYSQYRHARRGCHLFVFGLLITPNGRRVVSFRCYHTREYCQQHGLPHYTQADLGAQLVRELAVATSGPVVVLADTAFESRQLRAACESRNFAWIMPANPERVLAGGKPRPSLWSLTKQFSHRMFAPIRLSLGQGAYAAMRRLSASSRGSNRTRTFYVHQERCKVHSVGEVRIVFSTKTKPQSGKPLDRKQTKVLLSNDLQLGAAEIVELYSLRWQIELFFKELKSNLGMHQYRFRDFDRVSAWIELFRITFHYLEWVRAQKVRACKGRKRAVWSNQRTHGLCLEVCTRLDEAQLASLQRQTSTPSGLRKLRKLLRNALPTEHPTAA